VKKLICPLAAIFLAALAPLAHAGLEINYAVSGGGPSGTCGPVANTPPATTVTCTNVVGPETITGLTAFSNAPGGPNFALETSATSTLQNDDTVSHTFTINIISTGFTFPAAPPAITLLSHIGGSTPFLAAGTNSVSFISCVDTTNSQTAGCPATFNAPTINPVLGGGSYQGDSSSTIASLAGTYAIDEQITVVLAAGSTLNFSASTTLVPTPEPMSIVFLGSVVLLCSGLARRKRKSASQV